jgi:hypothetical protein
MAFPAYARLLENAGANVRLFLINWEKGGV